MLERRFGFTILLLDSKIRVEGSQLTLLYVEADLGLGFLDGDCYLELYLN